MSRSGAVGPGPLQMIVRCDRDVCEEAGRGMEGAGCSVRNVRLIDACVAFDDSHGRDVYGGQALAFMWRRSWRHSLNRQISIATTWNIAQLQTIETVRNWQGVGQQQQQFHVGLTAAHWSRIPGVSEPTVPPVRQSVDIRGHQIAEPSGGRRQLLALPHGCLLHVQKSRLSADISISAWRNNRPKLFEILRHERTTTEANVEM